MRTKPINLRESCPGILTGKTAAIATDPIVPNTLLDRKTFAVIGGVGVNLAKLVAEKLNFTPVFQVLYPGLFNESIGGYPTFTRSGLVSLSNNILKYHHVHVLLSRNISFSFAGSGWLGPNGTCREL